MDPKERVRAAIRHEQPDRVPVDFAARGEVVAALRQRLRLGRGESLEERLGVDLRWAGPDFVGPRAADLAYADPTIGVSPDGTHFDIWGVGFRPNYTASGSYMDLASSPLAGADAFSTSDAEFEALLERHAWPSVDWWDFSRVRERAEAESRYCVVAHSRGCFEISWFLRGFDGLMMDLAAAPERAGAVMDRVMAHLMERAERMLDAARGAIDMFEYNDDVGGQNGLLLGPDMWREHVKPRMARIVATARAAGCAVRYHSCGGVRPIIDDLVEIGVDVLNPVQTLAAGMEPAALKEDFGDRITFNGGIDTQDLLPHASADEVREETRRLIDVLGQGGGYILAPSHVFQGDVPVENVLAVYEAALGHALA